MYTLRFSFSVPWRPQHKISRMARVALRACDRMCRSVHSAHLNAAVVGRRGARTVISGVDGGLQSSSYPAPTTPALHTALDCSTDAHVCELVRLFLQQIGASRGADSAAGACQQLAALGPASLPRALERCFAASPHALQLAYALRDVCGDKQNKALPWAKTLDAAVVDRIRVLFTPACVPLTQLSLSTASGGAAAPFMSALLAAAEAGEQVHKTNDPTAFRRKLGPRRMIHALSHSAARHELLAVLYSAILPGMPASMAQIDAMSGGEPDALQGHWDLARDLSSTPGGAVTRAAGGAVLPATTVAFYSVSAQHAGTRGLRMGTRIIYATAAHIAAHAPEVRTFCTMSPIPGFVDWLEVAASLGKLHPLLADASSRSVIDAVYTRIASAGEGGGAVPSTPELAAKRLSHILVASPQRWYADPHSRTALQPLLTALVRHYLLLPSGGRGAPTCKVAAFHLGNGARLHRIAWAADASPAGLQRSASLMVNYLYSHTGGDGLHDTMFRHAAEYARSPGDVLRAQAPVIA